MLVSKILNIITPKNDEKEIGTAVNKSQLFQIFNMCKNWVRTRIQIWIASTLKIGSGSGYDADPQSQDWFL